MGKIFCDMFGEENVTRIAAIHHSLRDIDPGAGHVSCFVNVFHVAYRAAVNAHSHLDLLTAFQLSSNRQRALRGFFRTAKK